MAPKESSNTKTDRKRLIDGLNEDLSREYQAIIAYVVYSQVLKGTQYMSIAAELEKHALEELRHAILVAKQIDYLGGNPAVTPKPVKTSEDGGLARGQSSMIRTFRFAWVFPPGRSTRT